MTDRLQSSAEWEAQERYLRFYSHAHNATLNKDYAAGDRWLKRAWEARDAWKELVKDRESK